MTSQSLPPNVASPPASPHAPQQPKQQASLLGLLSRFSAVRTRSSTIATSVTTPSPSRASSADSGRPVQSDARERLLSILASAKHKRHPSTSTAKQALSQKIVRSISGPASSTSFDVSNDPPGPFDPVHPQVYLQLLAKASATSSTSTSAATINTKVRHLLALSQTLSIFEDVDPLQIWLAVADHAHALEPVEIRLAALEVLRVCISLYVAVDSSALTIAKSAYQKQEFYASICTYGVDLKECTLREIKALTDALDALSRGGRDVTSLDGVLERTCDWAGEKFKRRQADRDRLREAFLADHKDEYPPAFLQMSRSNITPLQDPTYTTFFVAWPIRKEEEADTHASAMRLLTNMHKFSWSHLSADSIIFATNYLVTEALATSNDHVVQIVLEHIDVMSRYGFVPLVLIENVVYFLARVVSMAGRCNVLVFDSDEDGNAVSARLEPFPQTMPNNARRIVRNLLKSSANQALRFLRTGTAPPKPSDRRDMQIPIGCLQCIRDALNEFRSTPAYKSGDTLTDSISSTFLDSWPILIAMGLPYFYPNLCDALDWDRLDVTEQVLLLVLDRLLETSIESIEPAAPITPVMSPAKRKTPVLDKDKFDDAASHGAFNASHIAYDEWDLILDLVERSLRQLHRYEDEMDVYLPFELVDGLEDDLEDEGIPRYASVLRQIVVLTLKAYLGSTYQGPLDRLFSLYVVLEPNLTDGSGVLLLDAYYRENICLPSNPGWLADMLEICRTFLSPDFGESAHLRQSRSSESSDPNTPKLNRPLSKARCLLLVRTTFEEVSASTSHRASLLAQVIMPLLENFLQPQIDTYYAPLIRDLVESVAKNALSIVQRSDDVAEVEDAMEVLSRIRNLLINLVNAPTRVSRQNSVNKGRSTSIPNRLMQKTRPLEPFMTHNITMTEFSTADSENGPEGTEWSSVAVLTLISILSYSLEEGTPKACREGNVILHALLDMLDIGLEYPSACASRRVRFIILQYMLRLRAISSHRLQLATDANIVELATALGRGLKHDKSVLSPPSAAVKLPIEEREARSRAKEPPQNHRSRSSSRTRSASRPREAGPPLWHIPEVVPFALPILKDGCLGMLSFDSHIEWTETPGRQDDDFTEYLEAREARPTSAPVLCPVFFYLEIIIKILRLETDWDFLAYTLCHLPEQLSNKHLFSGPLASRQIKILRAVLCDCLSSNSLSTTTHIPSASKVDLPIIAYQSLATLIAYKSLFDMADQEELVKTFTAGLKTREVAKPCVHALAMCCYEFQSSIVKCLSPILGSFAGILSTANMAVHVLEFLGSVGQISDLYGQFTDADYERVFSIALQYIAIYKRFMASKEEISEVQHAFSQYVHHMAYYVIDLWYMSLDYTQRKKYVGLIARELIQTNGQDGALDEASEVCLDMVARYAHGNVDPRPRRSALRNALLLMADTNKNGQADATRLTWIVGHAVISVRTMQISRWTELTIRRPSGLVQLLVELENVNRPQLRSDKEIMSTLLEQHEQPAPLHDDAQQLYADLIKDMQPDATKDTLSTEKITSKASAHNQPDIGPSFFGVQLSSYPDFGNAGPPILVPEEERFQRSIKTLDSVPVVDFHKIAVLYVGPEDFTENDVLANTHGSKDYVRFLGSLGRLVNLKGNETHYLGGLDKVDDSDGRWAYVWDNNVTQIIYHVATLMPTNLEVDAICMSKKSHIGNDFVKIIFNDSGRPYAQETVLGQFNFINIVIEPQTSVGKTWTARGMTSNATFYKVSMQRRHDMPDIGPVGVFKMVSEDSIGEVARQLALHANVFAQVFLDCVGISGPSKGERPRAQFISNWRRRLQMIKELKRRLTAEQAANSSSENTELPNNVKELLKAYDFSLWS